MKKGEIWLVELPTTDSHEQAGTRPVIVLLETEVNIVIIIPLTSNLQALRFPHTIEIKPSSLNGLNSLSVGLLFQIRAIDKIRLKNKIGDLEDSTLIQSDALIKRMLHL